MNVRNRLYDRGVFRSHSLGARAISIGNLTAGGTGKTPLVALTARLLAENGETVCVLTRGYGRASEKERVLVSNGETVLVDASTGGDEPVELARKLLGEAIVVADADRVGAAEWAKKQFGVTAFVMDDAFQHRRAKRDVDVVCIDGTNPCGNGQILPAGTLRESFEGIRRADVVIVTRADLGDATGELVSSLRGKNTTAPIFTAATRLSVITKLSDFLNARTAPDDEHLNQQATFPLVFCGLGSPENFRRQFETANFGIAGFRSFTDHHRYVQRDIDHLQKEAEKLSATSLMTTAKDAVKLAGLRFELPVFVLEMEISLNDEEEFRRLILARG